KAPEGKAVLDLHNLSGQGFNDVSLTARKGEILGLFGLVGSGIDELAKSIFGALPISGGQIQLNGEPIRVDTPDVALRKGIFLLPGDRRTEGLVMPDNVVFNTTLANLDRASKLGGLLNFGRNSKDVAGLARKVDLTPPALNRPAADFSGGNQQKIVVAKGLYSQADVYIFVEPTVGVDIGARAKVYALMRELSKEAAVIVMSSDCDEAFGAADCIGAMYRGNLVLEPSYAVTRDQVLRLGIMGSEQE
ncbi:MAG: ATP-binding cassette domain-containing protein, partial [Phycisphaerales bacterium]|nr:ATP-binding cassette domain-containing protein [Phycisphaerales bacterium]